MGGLGGPFPELGRPKKEEPRNCKKNIKEDAKKMTQNEAPAGSLVWGFRKNCEKSSHKIKNDERKTTLKKEVQNKPSTRHECGEW